MKSKTVLEWYKQLPEPLSTKAIAEYSGNYSNVYTSLEMALASPYLPLNINNSYWNNVYVMITRGYDINIHFDVVEFNKNKK
jgi:hypothetical protein